MGLTQDGASGFWFSMVASFICRFHMVAHYQRLPFKPLQITAGTNTNEFYHFILGFRLTVKFLLIFWGLLFIVVCLLL